MKQDENERKRVTNVAENTVTAGEWRRRERSQVQTRWEMSPQKELKQHFVSLNMLCSRWAAVPFLSQAQSETLQDFCDSAQ